MGRERGGLDDNLKVLGFGWSKTGVFGMFIL